MTLPAGSETHTERGGVHRAVGGGGGGGGGYTNHFSLNKVGHISHCINSSSFIPCPWIVDIISSHNTEPSQYNGTIHYIVSVHWTTSGSGLTCSVTTSS